MGLRAWGSGFGTLGFMFRGFFCGNVSGLRLRVWAVGVVILQGVD